MANTTLGVTGIVTVTLQNLDNINIQENTVKKEALLAPNPMYTKDSDETYVFDYGGCIKLITLTGTYVGSTLASCKSFIDGVELLIQGQQDKQNGYPATFIDDLRATSPGMRVKILDFNSTMLRGEPTKCTWTIRLIQASPDA